MYVTTSMVGFGSHDFQPLGGNTAAPTVRRAFLVASLGDRIDRFVVLVRNPSPRFQPRCADQSLSVLEHEIRATN